MAAMLGDSAAVVVVVVMRTRPRAIPLAMITMRKSTHGFPFLSCMSMGLRLAAFRAAGAPLKATVHVDQLVNSSSWGHCIQRNQTMLSTEVTGVP